jgi:hypothetical protein
MDLSDVLADDVSNQEQGQAAYSRRSQNWKKTAAVDADVAAVVNLDGL